MDEDGFKGLTQQPVVAERHLSSDGTSARLTIRIHQPELGGVFPGRPWRCGYVLHGLPGLPAFYDDPEFVLADGEVWFADGEDSFGALTLAVAEIRAMLDRVEADFGVIYVWPPRADWGHMVPHWVEQAYGRSYEQRLLDVMEEEQARMTEARTPNPYAWDDPRHPSQIIRQQAEEQRKRRELDDPHSE